MSVIIQAPWDLIQTTTLLPSPNFGDYINPQVETVIRNSENGVIYSYVKTNERVKRSWDFRLTVNKSKELFAFIERYGSLEWRITDWEDRVYKMKLLTNPVEFTSTGPGMVSTRLEFEGVRLV